MHLALKTVCCFILYWVSPELDSRTKKALKTSSTKIQNSLGIFEERLFTICKFLGHGKLFKSNLRPNIGPIEWVLSDYLVGAKYLSKLSIQSIANFLSAEPGTKVLVATGYPVNNGVYTEIIDLENPSFTCSKVGQFPILLTDATGGLVGQTPLICGGWSKACHTLLENGSWKEDKVATLNTGRHSAAYGSVVINDQLVVAGGHDGYGNRFNTIELVAPNTRSRTLSVKLPVAVLYSCIVEWDENSFMLIGGYRSSGGGSFGERRETYIIDTDKNTITNGPNLKTGRYHHGCEKIDVNGESFIVVSGGYGVRSTEVLSVANYRNGGWQYGKNCIKMFFKLGIFLLILCIYLGPNLPVNMAEHEMVASPNNQVLYTFGNDYHPREDIYKFSCSGNINLCQWTKSNLKLKYGRKASVAFRIPDSLANKLCN